MTIIGDKDNLFAVHGVSSRILDGCMVDTRTIQPAGSCGSFPRHAFVFIICDRGEVNLECDNVPYSISSNNLFICLPNSAIRLSSETDSRIRFLSVNQEFLQRHYLLQRVLIPYLLRIKQMPLLDIPEVEYNRIWCMMHCAEWHLAESVSSECIREAAVASIQMTLYNICQYIKSVGSNCAVSSCKREDELYLQFMMEVLLHYKKERRLEFYASRLYISSKHLGNILKKKTGKKATELINSILVEDIKCQLKYTNEPIKTICDNFNFPNPSFFGKFFKNMVGISPMKYREERRSL